MIWTLHISFLYYENPLFVITYVMSVLWMLSRSILYIVYGFVIIIIVYCISSFLFPVLSAFWYKWPRVASTPTAHAAPLANNSPSSQNKPVKFLAYSLAKYQGQQSKLHWATYNFLNSGPDAPVVKLISQALTSHVSAYIITLHPAQTCSEKI